jgi:hypothetical protein
MAPEKRRQSAAPFARLQYIYTPSRDVANDVRFFTDVLGGRLVFAIEAMGARVAKIALTRDPPHVLLTDHLEGDRPVLVYRVADVDKTVSRLRKNGWKKGHSVELPVGPGFSFSSSGGHRIAVYEASRSSVEKSFEGRFDF